MKRIRFHPNVREEVRAIEQRAALNILSAIHRYAATGAGRVKSLSGEFEGLLRLRVGFLSADRILRGASAGERTCPVPLDEEHWHQSSPTGPGGPYRSVETTRESTWNFL